MLSERFFMNILKSMAIAFSSYSRIPMPQFAWKEENMRYVMAFFPLVGTVIGALEYVWFLLYRHLSLPEIVGGIIAALIPVLITGGFHLDGFMDTSDALSSHQDREKKLKILKDSHVGAFAVIRLLTAAGLYTAAASLLRSSGVALIFALSFVASRCLSAFAVLHFRSAVHTGSLFYTASAASRRINTIAVMLVFAAAAAAMILSAPLPGSLTAAAALASLGYYRFMSYRQFGGITGDLAGYFVVISEIAMAVAAAAGGLCLQIA